MFHHEISRSRAEHTVPFEGPGHPGAIPWILFGLLAVFAMASLEDLNVHDAACMPVDRGVDDRGWVEVKYESSEWPPGQRCEITMDDGTVVVDDPGWGIVYASGAGLALVAAGFLHPRETSWRRMAHVLLIPGTLVAFIALSLLTGFPFYVGTVVLGFALVPALATWAATNALTTWPRGRSFVGSWLGWGLVIGTGAVIAGVT